MQRTVTLPAAAVLAIAGGIGWLVGTAAFATGLGTVVLAAGLGFTVWLVILARRSAVDHPIESWRTRKLLRLVVIGAVLIVGGGAVLGLVGYGELALPLGFGIIGVLLLPASSLLQSRGYLALGGALMVLSAIGAVVALNSAGDSVPRAIVGLGSGVLLWFAAARRADLLHGLPDRVREFVERQRYVPDTGATATDDLRRGDPAPSRPEPRGDAPRGGYGPAQSWDGRQDPRRHDRGPDTRQF